MIRCFLVLLAVGGAALADEGKFALTLRKRAETSPNSGRFHTLSQGVTWPAKKTAVIVCDMWDLHHCLNATRRGAELAPRMNELLNTCRERGATIIHAPSSCMDTYKEHPARKRALAVPRAEKFPVDIEKWCHRIPEEEKGKYPIDQSDGGEDDDPAEHKAWAEKLKAMGRNPRAPWKSQTDKLTIRDQDYISDSGTEIWSILDHHKLDQVILLGVHTNMCVLGRPFGLRQMARNGKNVVLVRDMTDTMYNPARAPYVSHFTGTDFIVEHIEKFVCPTITSDQILGGKPFRFAGDRRPHVAIIMAEDEYRTEKTLPQFARDHLGKDFQVSLIFGSDQTRNNIPGLEALDHADLVLLSVRRRPLPAEQLQRIRKFVEAGKPVVAIRTSSHGFAPPLGTKTTLATWETFDPDVLGGNYKGHHKEGPKTAIEVTPEGAKHPILAGVKLDGYQSGGSLYKVSPLKKSTRVLLLGSTAGQPKEPVAWVNQSAAGGKVFYTALGHVSDFEQPAFKQLLRNAILWAAAR